MKIDFQNIKAYALSIIFIFFSVVIVTEIIKVKTYNSREFLMVAAGVAFGIMYLISSTTLLLNYKTSKSQKISNGSVIITTLLFIIICVFKFWINK